MTGNAFTFEKKSNLWKLPGLIIIGFAILAPFAMVFVFKHWLLKIFAVVFGIIFARMLHKELRGKFKTHFRWVRLEEHGLAVYLEPGGDVVFPLPESITGARLDQHGHITCRLKHGGRSFWFSTWEYKNNKQLRALLYQRLKLGMYTPGEPGIKPVTPKDIKKEAEKPARVHPKTALIAILMAAFAFVGVPFLIKYLKLPKVLFWVFMLLTFVMIALAAARARSSGSRFFFNRGKAPSPPKDREKERD